MAKPGPKNLLTDVPGLRVGQAEDARVRTGTTVVLPDTRAVCSVVVSGGAPGTRETDAIQPHVFVDAVDAVVLSGGSAYGLGAADGATAALGAAGIGFAAFAKPGVPVTPVIPAAILYDLANGGDKAWGETPPYPALGVAAVKAASADFALGRAGAGYGAKAGRRPGGTGSASLVTEDGYTVGAIVAVNSFGSVTMPGTEAFWAWPWEIDSEFGGVRPPEGWRAAPEDWGAAKPEAARENTTIAVVATDAILTPGRAKRFAAMAQAGLARAIRPIFSPYDGDAVFGMATGRLPLAEPEDFTLARLGNLAADCLARAVARAVYEAGKP